MRRLRMELELDLEHALALAYGQAKGFAAPEVEAALSRAHELCLRTGKTAKLGPVVSELARFHWFCGDLSAAKALISQLLDNPDTTSDDEQLMVTHGLMGALLGETGERFQLEVHLADPPIVSAPLKGSSPPRSGLGSMALASAGFFTLSTWPTWGMWTRHWLLLETR